MNLHTLRQWLPFLNWPRPTKNLLKGEFIAGMTVGLLTSLVAVNTVVSGTTVVLDARLAALAAAAIALWLRAPYLVVVVVGAVAAALVRLAGF